MGKFRIKYYFTPVYTHCRLPVEYVPIDVFMSTARGALLMYIEL